jgi:hypothetical protein
VASASGICSETQPIETELQQQTRDWRSKFHQKNENSGYPTNERQDLPLAGRITGSITHST